MIGEGPFSDYVVFVDESGDHGLVTINPEFPLFVLVFVIVEKSTYANRIVPAFKTLKFRFWGHDAAILHAHEIRKPRGDFGFLQIRERRDAFIEALNRVVEDAPITVAAAVIRKEPLLRRVKDLGNVYHLALGLCMKAASDFLAARGQVGRVTHLVAEARGNREDAELELEFRRTMDGEGAVRYGRSGTPFDIRIVSKKVNSEGLQLADLLAHPIGRHVLKPDQANRAFEIIHGKLLADSDGLTDGVGLIIFP